MVYSPTLATIKTARVADNLLTWLLDNTRQGEAYTWAGNGNLKKLKRYESNVNARSTPIYPAIAFSDDNDAQDLTKEVQPAVYSVRFLVSIQNASADTAVTQAKVYRDALVSLIVNCPMSTLIANTGASTGVIETIETGFGEIKTNKTQTDFLQEFSITVTAVLRAAFAV